MTDIKIRTPLLGAEVKAVLGEVRVTGARKQRRRAVNRMAPAIRGEEHQTRAQPLLQPNLQRMVGGVSGGFQLVDVGKLRQRTRVIRVRARQGLIQIPRADKVRAFRPHVAHTQQQVTLKFLLQVHAPLLLVGGLEITLVGNARPRERKSESGGKGIIQRQKGKLRREKEIENEEGRIEVKPVGDGQRGLVIIDAITGAQYGPPAVKGTP